MKNFLIALVIAIILVNCLGSLVDSWLGMHIIMSDQLLSPWENVAVLSLIGVVLAVVGFVVAVSVMGTILLALSAGFLALLVQETDSVAYISAAKSVGRKELAWSKMSDTDKHEFERSFRFVGPVRLQRRRQLRLRRQHLTIRQDFQIVRLQR